MASRPTSDLSEAEWKLVREAFGDMAYEEPHMHQQMLEMVRRAALKLIVDNTSK